MRPRVLRTRGVDAGRPYVLVVSLHALGVRFVDLTSVPTNPARDRAVVILAAPLRTPAELADALEAVAVLGRSQL